MDPKTAITIKSIFTDLRYLLVSGFVSPLENLPAPMEMTK